MGGGVEMYQCLANGYWTDFLMFSRSKFATAFVNGISVSFFNNCIVNTKQ